MAAPYPLTALLAGSLLAAGCATPYMASPRAVTLNLPPVHQSPDRCGPAMLAAVYGYWEVDTTEAEVALRVYNPNAPGTLAGMLVADARARGWRAALGPAAQGDWLGALRAGVPVICMQPAGGSAHFVLLQGFDRDRFLVNDGTGQLRWRPGGELALPDALSIYTWPREYGFDPPSLTAHDAGP